MGEPSGRPARVPPRWFVTSFWKAHRAFFRATRGRGLWTPESRLRWGALRLTTTGLDLTAGEFATYVAMVVVALWLIAAATLAPFFGPIAGAVGVWAAAIFLNWQRQKRIEAFINQLPDVARLLANATAAGLALRTALAMAAEELEAPAGEELARVADQLALGRSVDDALGELAERLPSRELVVLVTTLVLSNKAGGTVVSSLRNLTQTLEDRKETRRDHSGGRRWVGFQQWTTAEVSHRVSPALVPPVVHPTVRLQHP